MAKRALGATSLVALVVATLIIVGRFITDPRHKPIRQLNVYCVALCSCLAPKVRRHSRLN